MIPAPPKSGPRNVGDNLIGIRGTGRRSKVEDVRTSRRHLRVVDALDAELADRPRTRGDCIGGQRPCPWVACKHNLYLDVTPNGIKLNFPDLAPEEMPADRSCALDVADMGGGTLEDIATCINVTRERARQIQDKARIKLHRKLLPHVDGDRWNTEGPPDERAGKASNGGSLFGDDARVADVPTRDTEADDDAPEADDHLGRRVRFIDASDDDITDKVWRLYERASRELPTHGPVTLTPSAPPERTPRIMSNTLPSHLQETLNAYKAIEARQAAGMPVRAKDVARELDDGTNDVAVTARLLKLRKMGILPKGRRSPGQPAVSADKPKPSPVKPTTKPAPTSDGTLLMRLEAERDKHRAVADKLDETIEALQDFA